MFSTGPPQQSHDLGLWYSHMSRNLTLETDHRIEFHYQCSSLTVTQSDKIRDIKEDSDQRLRTRLAN
jgi:hypothetical protein